MLTNFSNILKLTTNVTKVIYADARRTIEGKERLLGKRYAWRTQHTNLENKIKKSSSNSRNAELLKDMTKKNRTKRHIIAFIQNKTEVYIHRERENKEKYCQRKKTEMAQTKVCKICWVYSLVFQHHDGTLQIDMNGNKDENDRRQNIKLGERETKIRRKKI